MFKIKKGQVEMRFSSQFEKKNTSQLHHLNFSNNTQHIIVIDFVN